MAPEEHAGKAYDLTGLEALNLFEVAEAISSAQGRTVTFHNETVEEAYESRRAWPAEQWEYAAWVSTYTAIASGELSEVSGDVQRVMGLPPMTFGQFLQAQRD